MKNIVYFMKGSGKALAMIALLLILQAFCDLSLPAYTSDILNIGLQQSGIEDGVPETIRKESLTQLELFIPDADIQAVEAAYEESDENGVRALKADADRKELASILERPESLLLMMQQAQAGLIPGGTAQGVQEEMAPGETAQQAGAFSPELLAGMLSGGMINKEDLLGKIQEQMAEVSDMTDTYLRQMAVLYVRSEYEAQGLDVTAIQNAYLFRVGFMMLLMTLLMTLCAVLTGLLASRTSAGIGMRLRESLYEKVMRFTNEEMEHFSTASLITRSTNDVQQIQMVVVMLLRMVAYAPILAIFGIIRVVQTGSGMGWIIVLAVVILSACIGILVGVAMPKFQKMQKLIDRLNQVSREILTGVMPIRAFSREIHEEERFRKASYDLYSTQLFTGRVMTFMSPVMMLVMNGVSVLIVWIGAGKVDTGTIQVGDLTAFITYSMVIVMGFLMLSMISVLLPRAGVAADRIREVLDMPIALSDPEHAQDEKLYMGNGTLTFQDVSFAYPGADGPALEHISFTAKPGKTTAIIGSTGCGKTTLLNLIPRFYDVTSGRITLNGVDIRDVSQKALREQIGYVPQKSMLFSGTVESNIKYSGDQVSGSDMRKAARIAQAEDFILEKPNGYETAIAQEGGNVSGGQKQRISIARAIAKHPQIFLFDDSFSALDYKTDLALRKALAEEASYATVIIVAQRISTILHADQILCMDDGKIVGIGTHEELMASCRTYQEIARSQLSEAELEKGGAR